MGSRLHRIYILCFYHEMQQSHKKLIPLQKNAYKNIMVITETRCSNNFLCSIIVRHWNIAYISGSQLYHGTHWCDHKEVPRFCVQANKAIERNREQAHAHEHGTKCTHVWNYYFMYIHVLIIVYNYFVAWILRILVVFVEHNHLVSVPISLV